MELIAGGLPRPEAQWVVDTRHGEFVARVDLAYPELKIAIEYDGAWHWKQRREDERRWARLRAEGWVVLVYSADDVFNTPLAMCAEVRATRRARAA